MQTILEGSLGHFPPDQILTFLSMFSHNGTLEVACKKKQARLLFETGAVVHAESNVPGDVDEILRDLFVWLEGTFSFSPELVLPEGVQRTSTDLRIVIQEGLQRATEWKRLLELFPTEDIGLRVIDEPKTDGVISLNPEELRILLRIGSGRTLGRLLADLQRPALQLYPIVHRLESAGLLERIRVADQEPTQPQAETSSGPSEGPPFSKQEHEENVDESFNRIEIIASSTAITETAPAEESMPREAEAVPPPPPKAGPELSGASPSAAAPTAGYRAPANGDGGVEHGFRGSHSANLLPIENGGLASDTAKPELVGTLTESGGRLHPLEEKSTIGRTATNTIALRDQSVSASHAFIVRTEEGFMLEDGFYDEQQRHVESRNGTFVNDERVRGTRLLADCDVVRVGKFFLTFNVASDAPPIEPTKQATI